MPPIPKRRDNPTAPQENEPVGVLANDDEALHEQLQVPERRDTKTCPVRTFLDYASYVILDSESSERISTTAASTAEKELAKAMFLALIFL